MPYKSMDELKETCMSCRACGLCAERTHVVFGVGDEHSRLLFIGEGPGENEDLQGEPFVGRAGKLLDKYLADFCRRRCRGGKRHVRRGQRHGNDDDCRYALGH